MSTQTNGGRLEVTPDHQIILDGRVGEIIRWAADFSWVEANFGEGPVHIPSPEIAARPDLHPRLRR